MSLFPQRASLEEFLKMYSQLPSDDEDDPDHVDLRESSGEEDSDDDQEEEAILASWLQPDPGDDTVGEEAEAPHKDFDAALRDAERQELEKLAVSFEARAYDDELGPRHSREPFYDAELRAAALAAKQKREQELEAALEAEAAAAAAADREKKALLAARKAALDALYADESESTPKESTVSMAAVAPCTTAGSATSAAPPPAAIMKRPLELVDCGASSSGARYRIKKKRA